MSEKKLWEGSTAFKENSHLFDYKIWLEQKHNLYFDSYDDLWQWSVSHIKDFWESIWHYFNVLSYGEYKSVLSMTSMPDFNWFDGVKLNYAEHIFRHNLTNETAIIFSNEHGDYSELSWNDLKDKVAAMASYLKSIGVSKGN